MATVLVLDGLQRKSLALTRVLGAAGHRVLTADSTFFAISRFSRFSRKAFVYPHPDIYPLRFVDWLLDIVAQEQVDAVLPSDDATTGALATFIDRFEGKVGLLVPPRASFAAMRDKGQSVAWFQRAGVPHPRTIVVQNLNEVPSAARDLGMPLVIKPRITSGSRGMRFVERISDVERIYMEVHRHHPWPILQQFITPGPKYHACLMYDRHHRLAARYVQRELRQYPVSGGPSTAQESVDRLDLIGILEPLFGLLPWIGPLHADVMEDGHTGQPYILEVNPRYWQSLHVAHRAGVSFALLNLALALGRDEPPALVWKSGVQGRALLPFDILSFLTDPNRLRWSPAFFAPYGPLMRDDLLSWDDPMPTAGFLLAVVRYLFDRSMWRAVLRLDNR